MRSQLMILSMISLAVTGCGKDVQKNGAMAGQMNPTGVLGQCADPIAPPQTAAISRFSDLAKPGVYRLVSFEAVGSASANTGAISGISVVVGSMQANGQPTYSQRCQDMSGMPTSTYSWNVSAPAQVSAENGTIAEMVAFRQTMHGPQAPGNMQQNLAAGTRVSIEMAQGCRSADAAIRGEGCSASTYYQLDANTIGVLRMTEARETNGTLVRTKIYAKYSLNGAGNQPMNPMPPMSGDDGFGAGHPNSGEQYGDWDSDDEREYSGSEKTSRQEQPTKKGNKLPPVNPANKKLLPNYKGGNGQGIDPTGNGQGIDPVVVIRTQPEVRTIVGVVYPHSHPVVVAKEKSDVKVKIDTDGDVKLKLKDKEKSKVKSSTEKVTVTKAADGSVSTSTLTEKMKAKEKSKLKIKVKKD